MDNYQDQSKSKALRQKAISLLYLLFIALVFIYVPADFLDSLKETDDSLVKTRKEINDLKKLKFAMFEGESSSISMDQVVDSFKYFTITSLSDSAINHISKLKRFLINETGGYGQHGYPAKNKEFDVTDHLMLNTGRATELFGILKEYKSQIAKVIETTSFDLLDSVLVLPEQYTSSQGKQVSWQDFFFKKAPLSATLMTLSKFQAEVRLIEYLVLDKYQREFLEDVFTKSGAENIVMSTERDTSIPNVVNVKNIYRIGEEVVFFANKYKELLKQQLENEKEEDNIDVEKEYKLYIENNKGIKEPLEVDNNGMIKYTPPKTGEYTLTSKVDGKEEKIKIKVVNSNPNVAKKNLEILYTGIRNPLKLEHLGGSLADVSVSVSSGNLRKVDSFYYFQTNRVGVVRVEVKDKKDGKLIPITQKEFLVKELPLPYAVIDEHRGGSISTRQLKAQKKLSIKSDVVESINFHYVKEFNVLRISSGGVIVNTTSNQGATFSNTAANIINEAVEGDIIIFKDIKVVGNDGNLKDLQAIVFNLT